MTNERVGRFVLGFDQTIDCQIDQGRTDWKVGKFLLGYDQTVGCEID